MENKTSYGELVYSNSQLQIMNGYHSDNDPAFLTMPFLFWRIDKNECRFVFWEHQAYIRNNPYLSLEYLPGSVEFSFRKADEKRIMFTVVIPVPQIKQLTLKSVKHNYENYDVPSEYRCLIELAAGDTIEIVGKYIEDTDEWGYEHKVICKEYSE